MTSGRRPFLLLSMTYYADKSLKCENKFLFLSFALRVQGIFTSGVVETHLDFTHSFETNDWTKKSRLRASLS